MGFELHAFNTVRDIIQHLRISKSKFYEIVAEGLPATIYIGASPRWSNEDIASWIAVQTEKEKAKIKA